MKLHQGKSCHDYALTSPRTFYLLHYLVPPTSVIAMLFPFSDSGQNPFERSFVGHHHKTEEHLR
uniref:Uncharacterized protein n=1 Tax=Rhizophora mucronata TaxID=61149 RepID=A0A2P2QXJ2_RHIMU